jgi:Mn2+/Fe2+ NRAMP family transporter
MILISQLLTGMLLPVILIFMTLLVNPQGVIKEWTNAVATTEYPGLP